MTRRAVATSDVGGFQETPKTGVLTPFKRLRISDGRLR